MKVFGWMTSISGGAVTAALAGTLIVGAVETNAQSGTDAGASTFIVASRDAVPVPAPPDHASTEAELAELKRLTAERSAASAERAAYWATGGSAYRWNAVAAEEMIAWGIPTPAAARHMAPLGMSQDVTGPVPDRSGPAPDPLPGSAQNTTPGAPRTAEPVHR